VFGGFGLFGGFGVFWVFFRVLEYWGNFGVFVGFGVFWGLRCYGVLGVLVYLGFLGVWRF